MNDKLCEELSALVDDEVSEFGLRKILLEMDENPELAGKWSRYHIAKAALRNEAVLGVDLSECINAALAEEPCHKLSAGDEWRAEESASQKEVLSEKTPVAAFLYALGKPLSSAALAASVTLAAVLSWQEFKPSNGHLQEPAVAEIQLAGPDSYAYTYQPSSRAAVVAQTVSTQGLGRGNVARVAIPSKVVSAPSFRPVMSGASEQRMQVYMISHANYGAVVNGSGMMPFARLASAGKK